MESFYVTLPSSASAHLFNNTQSHFRVQLPHPVELEGEWMVGLSEIHIPTVWNNVTDLSNHFRIHFGVVIPPNRTVHEIPIPDFAFSGNDSQLQAQFINHITEQIPEHLKSTCLFKNKTGDKPELKTMKGYDVELNDALTKLLFIKDGKFLEINKTEKIQYNGGDLKMFIKCPPSIESVAWDYRIPEGMYYKVEHILQAILESMPENVRNKISFNTNRDGTISVICKDKIALEFPKQSHGLGSLLGFAEDQTLLSGISTGQYTVDLKGGVHGLYVYTDIISPNVVGDTHSPLLRVIPVEQEVKYSYVKIYTHPDFYKLQQNRFESIEIDIRTDFGQRLKFRHGKTLVKLLFKKV